MGVLRESCEEAESSDDGFPFPLSLSVEPLGGGASPVEGRVVAGASGFAGKGSKSTSGSYHPMYSKN